MESLKKRHKKAFRAACLVLTSRSYPRTTLWPVQVPHRSCSACSIWQEQTMKWKYQKKKKEKGGRGRRNLHIHASVIVHVSRCDFCCPTGGSARWYLFSTRSTGVAEWVQQCLLLPSSSRFTNTSVPFPLGCLGVVGLGAARARTPTRGISEVGTVRDYLACISDAIS